MNVRVVITEGPIGLENGFATANGAGAALSFRGVVRPLEGSRPISGLMYDVYEPMAQNVFRGVCEQAVDQFGLLSVELAHSKGLVKSGETSLWVRIHSEHRSAAIEAAGWLLDVLKRDVPIWKRPVFAAD